MMCVCAGQGTRMWWSQDNSGSLALFPPEHGLMNRPSPDAWATALVLHELPPWPTNLFNKTY